MGNRVRMGDYVDSRFNALSAFTVVFIIGGKVARDMGSRKDTGRVLLWALVVERA